MLELPRIVRPSSISRLPPLLILLHGFGSNEADLAGLSPYFDPRLTVASVRAPHALGPGSYAWYMIYGLGPGRSIDEAQARDSLRVGLDLVRLLPGELGCDPGRVLIGGFSQGAMLALGVCLNASDAVQGGLSMSGRLVPLYMPFVLPGKLPPILAQHGLYDPVVTIDEGREVRALLNKIGSPFEYREYPMQHTIGEQSLADAAAFLAGRVDVMLSAP